MALFVNPRQFQNDEKGQSTPGATYTFSESGGGTLKATYADAALTVPNSNPVVADGAGRFPKIYLSTDIDYRVVYSEKESPSTFKIIWTEDGVSGPLDNTDAVTSIDSVADLPESTGSGNQASVTGYYAATTVGGGDFADFGLARHNGVTLFDPDRAAEIGTAAYYVDSGVDADCWVRTSIDRIDVLMAGAVGDDVTDDKAAFEAAKSVASDTLHIPNPVVRYNLSNGIDWSNVNVFGGGKISCKLRFSTAQTDCITSTGNAVIRDLNIDGRWDGSTPGQAGDTIRVDSPTFIGEFHMQNCIIVNSKQDAIRVSNLGYSSLTDIQCNVSGRVGLNVDGVGSKTVTSLTLYGKNRFSDCPNNFGILVNEAHNCDFSGAIVEYTFGIKIDGSANRSLSFDSVYQEFGILPEAYTFTGSGDGLSITNNFGGGKTIPNTANFLNVTMFSNSNFSSIAPIQVNDLITADGVQIATAAVTGQTSQTAVATASPVPPGLWCVTSVVQTEDAGSSSLNSLSMFVTATESDSAYQASSATLVDLTDSNFNTPSPSSRLRVTGLLSISSATTVYLRFGHDQSAGQIAFIGNIKLERVK